ncbi:phosphoglucosamine mutase [Salarchaeum sp. JOR-1]|uniref:phosphoglucosamine mutase n=1 Tax=Salarchaeum sp. JOR-1 TaxID=2599399 RepID=UPI001198B94E|nr:phosphoglucosamine mutase [Salarchaeum sp. JOR-1]QDX40803.1 phosphoglucosamine mutase [Salarchaeum sp. JOR-1]
MFGTSGIRGPVGETVSTELAVSIGRTFPTAFPACESVLVGRDPRDSGRALVDALAAGLQEAGVDVLTTGIESTPTVARTLQSYDADAGIVVTASHNPPTDNGVKCWNPSGKAFTTAQQETLVTALETEQITTAEWDGYGTRRRVTDARTRHEQALLDSLDTELSGMDVVVDIGNGAGRITADVLAKVGASVTTLNGQPDGAFPGRPSEPTPDTCEDLCRLVRVREADLGIAHDGDADRMLAVDNTGAFVSGDQLLALFARDAINNASGSVVAAPLNTSRLVDDALAAVGGTVKRTQVGDVYVAQAAATDDDVVFGGEPSGAWIWPDSALCPDGPLAALTLTALLTTGPPLADRIDTLPTYVTKRESIEVAHKQAQLDAVRDHIVTTYSEEDVSTGDGVRVTRPDGWFLIRASGTEPLIRITAEAATDATASDLLETARELLAETVGDYPDPGR